MPLLRKFCCVAALLLMRAPAEATPLQPPHVLGDVLFTHPGIITETVALGTLSLSDPVWGSADLTIAGSPTPSITAAAASGPMPGPQTVARAVGILDYLFEILGPAGGVPMLVTVAGGVEATASLGASFALESSWRLTTPAALLASDSIATGQRTGSFSDSFAHTLNLVLQTNQLYTISMRADAAVAFIEGTSAMASAFIDPFFAFGPGVNPLDYTLNFSPGIDNTTQADPAAVPEPATGLLVLSGLAASFYRRRRRRAATR